MARWHLITGEYPPAFGGVADYSRIVAAGLARAGEQVSVWTPEAAGIQPDDEGVELNRIRGRFGPRALRLIGREIARRPGRLLVQYVPHSLGLKAMNLPFCLWLLANRRRPVWTMFHEVEIGFRPRQPMRHHVVAAVNRAMAAVTMRATERIFIATPQWEESLRRVDSRKNLEWLPVPSNIAVNNDPAAVCAIRARLAPAHTVLIGHLASPRDHTMTATIGAAVESAFAERPRARLLVLGNGSEDIRRKIVASWPAIGARTSATGRLIAADLSSNLSACDLIVQPYPDGISTRRTSAMAALVHRRALLTTETHVTEPLWRAENAVALVPASAIDALGRALARLIDDADQRGRLAAAGADLYARRFDLAHTIAALLSA